MISHDNIITTPEAYIKNGSTYTRLSKVLGSFTEEFLINWYKNTSKAKIENSSKRALRIGTAVDLACIEHIEGTNRLPFLEDSEEEVEMLRCLNAFKKWTKAYRPKFNDNQVTCFDNERLVAGTRDLLINDDTIVDIKTAKEVNERVCPKKYWLQVNKYADMEQECTINKVAVLRLDKLTGEFRYEVQPVDPELVTLFNKMADVYNYFNG